MQIYKDLSKEAKNLSSSNKFTYHLRVKPSGKILTDQDEEIEYKKLATMGKAKNKNTKVKIV